MHALSVNEFFSTNSFPFFHHTFFIKQIERFWFISYNVTLYLTYLIKTDFPNFILLIILSRIEKRTSGGYV